MVVGHLSGASMFPGTKVTAARINFVGIMMIETSVFSSRAWKPTAEKRRIAFLGYDLLVR
jgi:hypothetical protein